MGFALANKARCLPAPLQLTGQKNTKQKDINFLWEDSELSHIELGNGFFTRLEGENITGHLFLKLTRQEFREFGMGLRPALELEDYIKKLCE